MDLLDRNLRTVRPYPRWRTRPSGSCHSVGGPDRGAISLRLPHATAHSIISVPHCLPCQPLLAGLWPRPDAQCSRWWLPRQNSVGRGGRERCRTDERKSRRKVVGPFASSIFLLTATAAQVGDLAAMVRSWFGRGSAESHPAWQMLGLFKSVTQDVDIVLIEHIGGHGRPCRLALYVAVKGGTA